ncbi:MoaD/ThiS family protein [Pararhodonellum marinum]|uniref:MoaD/ThiS family protein n=1 Tax=Pararhodonellum marinum TaxID=2755358 RepID=UPI00188E436E|nr:MoaD/ThiS family protein [Pararhodonellum marinum]
MIKVKAFGKITEILENENLEFSGISDTVELKEFLEQSYPELKNLTYQIAVNRQIALDNTRLEEHSEVALLPPFSGG